MRWGRFTGFLPSAGIKWRRQLPGDRQNAWVTQYDPDIETYQWSVEDNTCGQTLHSGYADSLDEAFEAADQAEFDEYVAAAVYRRDVLRPALDPDAPCPYAIRGVPR